MRRLLLSSPLPKSTSSHVSSGTALDAIDIQKVSTSTGFDVCNIAKRLEIHGFTSEQAKAVLDVMIEGLKESTHNLKQRIRLIENRDNLLQVEINKLEEKFSHQKQQGEILYQLQLDMELMERRMLQCGIGLAGAFTSVCLGISRLV